MFLNTDYFLIKKELFNTFFIGSISGKSVKGGAFCYRRVFVINLIEKTINVVDKNKLKFIYLVILSPFHPLSETPIIVYWQTHSVNTRFFERPTLLKSLRAGC